MYSGRRKSLPEIRLLKEKKHAHDAQFVAALLKDLDVDKTRNIRKVIEKNMKSRGSDPTKMPKVNRQSKHHSPIGTQQDRPMSVANVFARYAKCFVPPGATFSYIEKKTRCIDLKRFNDFLVDYGLYPGCFASREEVSALFHRLNLMSRKNESRLELSLEHFDQFIQGVLQVKMPAHHQRGLSSQDALHLWKSQKMMYDDVKDKDMQKMNKIEENSDDDEVSENDQEYDEVVDDNQTANYEEDVDHVTEARHSENCMDYFSMFATGSGDRKSACAAALSCESPDASNEDPDAIDEVGLLRLVEYLETSPSVGDPKSTARFIAALKHCHSTTLTRAQFAELRFHSMDLPESLVDELTPESDAFVTVFAAIASASDVQFQLVSQQSECQSNQIALSESQQEVSALSGHLFESNQRVGNALHQLAQLTSEIKQNRQDIHKLNNQLVAGHNENVENQHRIGLMTWENDKLRSRSIALENQVTILEAAVASATLKVHELEHNLDHINRQKEQQTNKIIDLESTLEQKRISFEFYTSKICELDQNLNDMTSSYREKLAQQLSMFLMLTDSRSRQQLQIISLRKMYQFLSDQMNLEATCNQQLMMKYDRLQMSSGEELDAMFGKVRCGPITIIDHEQTLAAIRLAEISQHRISELLDNNQQLAFYAVQPSEAALEVIDLQRKLYDKVDWFNRQELDYASSSEVARIQIERQMEIVRNLHAQIERESDTNRQLKNRLEDDSIVRRQMAAQTANNNHLRMELCQIQQANQIEMDQLMEHLRRIEMFNQMKNQTLTNRLMVIDENHIRLQIELEQTKQRLEHSQQKLMDRTLNDETRRSSVESLLLKMSTSPTMEQVDQVELEQLLSQVLQRLNSRWIHQIRGIIE